MDDSKGTFHMKRWLKKWLPSRSSMQQNENTRWLSKWLHHHPYLWTLNRRTVAKGVAAGLLVAFVPIPVQLILASVVAFLIRANLPIAILSTLVTNPFTFVPINLLIYHIGIFITGENIMQNAPAFHALEFHWGNLGLVWQEIVTWLGSLGKSYLIGLGILSLSASITGFLLVHLFWRISVWIHLHSRRNRKKKH